jgi:predicted RNA methylase
MNESMERDEIKQLISDAMSLVDPPYRQLTIDDAVAAFERLKKSDPDSFVVWGDWVTRYEYRYPLSSVYIDSPSSSNDASGFFFQKARWACDSINSPSPLRTWRTERFRLTLLNALWTLKVDRVDSATLRTVISLRKYMASQFKPTAALAVYNIFQPVSVLDFCAGWGDRAVAAMASPHIKKYVGVDPNSVLVPCYREMCDTFDENGIVDFICAPAEDVKLHGKYDLVFTSPPYFNVERYSRDPTQSWVRYKKLTEWREKFLFTAIEKAWTRLKKGGYMVINISDVYSGHRINKICDPMNDYIKSLGGTYMGAIGYRLQKRANNTSSVSGVFGEPMWVWEK